MVIYSSINRFFASSTNDTEKVHFKVPSQLKESLRQAKQLAEQHFKEKQKAVMYISMLLCYFNF